jgi:hypothetical protein
MLSSLKRHMCASPGGQGGGCVPVGALPREEGGTEALSPVTDDGVQLLHSVHMGATYCLQLYGCGTWLQLHLFCDVQEKPRN